MNFHKEIIVINMNGLSRTDLRRVLVIKVLLDGTKWSTKDLLEKINNATFVANNPIFREVNENQDELEIFRIERISDAILSKILKSLRDDKIVETEAIPKKSGRGPARYRHWLVTDLEAYIKTMDEFFWISDKINKFDAMLDFEIGTNNGLIFLNSPYGQKFINMDLFQFFESLTGVKLDKKIKKIILEILSISPSSLKEFFDYSRFYSDFKKTFPNSAYTEDEAFIEEVMLHLVSAFTSDFSEPSFWTPYPIEYKSNLKLNKAKKNTVNTEVNYSKNLPKFSFDIKENEFSFDISFRSKHDHEED